MVFIKGLHGKPKEPSLLERLTTSYGEAPHPLKELEVPLREGVVSFSYQDRDFRNSGVFTIDPRKGIQIFTSTAHLRDFNEVVHDMREMSKRMNEAYRAEQADLRRRLKEDKAKERKFMELLEQSYIDPQITQLKQSYLDNELSEARRRIRENTETLGKPKPRHNAGIWLARTMNAPITIELGELSRVVQRRELAERKRLGFVPPRSEFPYDVMLDISIAWAQPGVTP